MTHPQFSCEIRPKKFVQLINNSGVFATHFRFKGLIKIQGAHFQQKKVQGVTLKKKKILKFKLKALILIADLS